MEGVRIPRRKVLLAKEVLSGRLSEDGLFVLGTLLSAYHPRVASAIALKIAELASRGDPYLKWKELFPDKVKAEENCLPWAEREGGREVRCWDYVMRAELYAYSVRRLAQDASWKLVNQPLLGGWVWVRKERLGRLLKEYVYLKLVDTADEARLRVNGDKDKPVDREAFPPRLKALFPELDKLAPKVEHSEDISAPLLKEEAFPPCIKLLISRIKRGDNLGHRERLALALFLIQFVKRGQASVDDIVEYFRGLPDFNKDKTKYYLEHAVKRNYLPMGCKSIEELGACPGCGWKGKVKTPWGAYLRNLRAGGGGSGGAPSSAEASRTSEPKGRKRGRAGGRSGRGGRRSGRSRQQRSSG